ncbi:MAG TPA: histidine kinase [Micromonosporaceae bacterium]|nr:histidine kinase [Micromonosporaceae bacterium]
MRYGWRAALADGLLAAALVVVGVFGTAGADMRTDADVAPDARAFTLAVVAAAALAVRRRWPLVTLAVVAGAATAYLVLGFPYGPILFVLVVAVYTVARHVPTRPAAVAAGLALLALTAHVFVGAGERPGLLGVVPASAWVVVPFALGLIIRLNREAAARERADQLRRHADAERMRVAQEVHDVVAHGLAAITMQADVTLHVLDRQSRGAGSAASGAGGPDAFTDQARTALEAIGRTSREALDELRATLAVVRREGSEPAERAPTPGLARLDALLARISGTGVPVRVETTGRRRDLPAAVDLTAYRVIQESLTNVLRHAGPAAATVRLDYGREGLGVEVTDTGRGPTAGGEVGHGVLGMRERVTALGGTFSAGPGPGGGFRVHALLPVEPR